MSQYVLDDKCRARMLKDGETTVVIGVCFIDTKPKKHAPPGMALFSLKSGDDVHTFAGPIDRILHLYQAGAVGSMVSVFLRQLGGGAMHLCFEILPDDAMFVTAAMRRGKYLEMQLRSLGNVLNEKSPDMAFYLPVRSQHAPRIKKPIVKKCRTTECFERVVPSAPGTLKYSSHKSIAESSDTSSIKPACKSIPTPARKNAQKCYDWGAFSGVAQPFKC